MSYADRVTAAETRWIELDGGVNTRDVGGLPTAEGGRIRSGVLLRSANLQHLTPVDIQRLVGELGLRRVVDLRTDVEVSGTGPGPLHAEPDVVIHHLSLYPDSKSDVPDPVLPWLTESPSGGRLPVVVSYLRYLARRPDSIVAALRAIAEPDGATLVHCAAGKDRTGMIVALALSVAGVPADDIAADYALTQSRIDDIFSHLTRAGIYGGDLTSPEKIPRAEASVMSAVLAAIDEDFGGVVPYLAQHGWTDDDTQRLRGRLISPAA